MGNDGGSIPGRRDLVKSSARRPTSSQVFEQNQLNASFDWTTCRLSSKPLCIPIVSDCLGHLYNKDAVLEYLISPEEFGDRVETIKTVRDVVELKISQTKGGKWICPITRKEIRAGGSKFVYHAECGHVFSETALKEIVDTACLECGTEYSKENIIVINPIAEKDIARLQERMSRLRAEGLSHSLKPVGGKKKRKHVSGLKDTVRKKERASATDKISNSLAVAPTKLSVTSSSSTDSSNLSLQSRNSVNAAARPLQTNQTVT
ncbi:Rtf2 RING-finger-domain-containing protein [Lipomyces oligophaga]|uniref:Rtf2 RING-finger-domain-containing protein n=1 Tax=Lipomyces oligophaga TaxID=45792 RepID=UPI0034CFA026